MKKIVIIHIAFLLAISLSAQSVKELQKQQRELQQQLEQTSHMLKQTKQSETATVNKLNLLNSDIKTRKKTDPEYPGRDIRVKHRDGAIERETSSVTRGIRRM